eukprot:TRINITY_DN17043_c0_g1_i1.p1 TRINITY_DN17043_c0_g1~~TRINITY_DN17043_c0_g1_i1.p1  ORF type:complete len:622 (+),score=73.81 TRINITY_DN17043_c0_g1_i1:330-2195(+)
MPRHSTRSPARRPRGKARRRQRRKTRRCPRCITRRRLCRKCPRRLRPIPRRRSREAGLRRRRSTNAASTVPAAPKCCVCGRGRCRHSCAVSMFPTASSVRVQPPSPSPQPQLRGRCPRRRCRKVLCAYGEYASRRRPRPAPPDGPWHHLLVAAPPGTSPIAAVERVVATGGPVLRWESYTYDRMGQVLPRGRRRVAGALLTPEDVVERTTELQGVNATDAAAAAWVLGQTHLATFGFGRATRLLANFNHLLNRLIPTLWVVMQTAAQWLLMPFVPELGLTVGAAALLPQFVAAAARGAGFAATLVTQEMDIPAGRLLPFGGPRCPLLCFSSATAGQPRWAPSSGVRLAILRGLRPGQALPGPRSAAAEHCAAAAAESRMRHPFEADPWVKESKGPRCRGAVRTAASAPRRRYKAVVIERTQRRRFGPEGIARITAAVRSAGWAVSVETPPVEAARAPLAEQVRPFADADVLVAASGAGMSWATFMPPGGVVLELAPYYACSVVDPGLNQKSARRADATCFGGMVRSAGLSHAAHAQIYAQNKTRDWVEMAVVRVHPESISLLVSVAREALRSPLTVYCAQRRFVDERPLAAEAHYHRCKLKGGTVGGLRTSVSVRRKRGRR